MAWVKEPKEPKKRAKKVDERKAVPCRNTNLFESLSRDRAKQVEFNKNRVGEIRKRVVKVNKEIDACSGRASIHKKRRLQRELDGLNTELDELINGMSIAEYDSNLKPFMDAARKVVQQESIEEKERKESAACERKRSRSGEKKDSASEPAGPPQRARRKIPEGARDVRVQSNGKNHCGKHRRDIVADELAHELEGVAPPLYMVSGDHCPYCGEGMMRKLPSESSTACDKCGKTCSYLESTSKTMGFGDDVEYASFSYKRQNHFQEWLNSCQAKETTEIPTNVLDAVMDKLYAQRLYDKASVTTEKVRAALKELRLRRYYENCTQICCLLTGRKPPRFKPEEEEQLKLMFLSIQTSFDRHCPPDRKNFLSYSYCLFKFCELLGLDSFLSMFSLLKGRDKLHRQDLIFKKICADLDWEFIPSV